MSTRGHTEAASVSAFFWDNFNVDAASDKELWFLANAAEQAESMAVGLADSVSNIGALILQEQQSTDRIKTGALQGQDLPGFLFGLADSLKTIGKMAFIGSEATFILQQRHAARAEGASQHRLSSATAGRNRAALALRIRPLLAKLRIRHIIDAFLPP